MSDRYARHRTPSIDPDIEHDVPHVLDEEDLEPGGSGLTDTPFAPEYERVARHDELARQLEDVVATAQAWAREVGTRDAVEIAEALGELYERVGDASEESDSARVTAKVRWQRD